MTFEPGQSGNPQGRPPKGKSWTNAIERAISRRANGDPQALEKLAEKLIRLAEKGDLGALKEVGNRIEGMPSQKIIGGDEDDNPIRVVTMSDEELIKRYQQQGKSNG